LILILGELVKTLAQRFRDGGILSPALDAEVLISSILEIERYKLIADKDRLLTKEEVLAVEKYAKRRLKFEPVAYITGLKEFYSLEFQVNKDVLIPRPETELLVDMAVYWGSQGSKVLDLGTGSGAIAVALKHCRPDMEIYASDISERALKIANKNAKRILGPKKIIFISGDLFTPFEGEKFNLIISNPPYIDADLKGKLQPEIDFEPASALFCGSGGREYIKCIIENAHTYLEEHGILLLEIGSDQQAFVMKEGRQYGYETSILNDYSGLPRVATLKR
jgi:release factor glutamine methyltransferase